MRRPRFRQGIFKANLQIYRCCSNFSAALQFPDRRETKPQAHPSLQVAASDEEELFRAEAQPLTRTQMSWSVTWFFFNLKSQSSWHLHLEFEASRSQPEVLLNPKCPLLPLHFRPFLPGIRAAPAATGSWSRARPCGLGGTKLRKERKELQLLGLCIYEY